MFDRLTVFDSLSALYSQCKQRAEKLQGLDSINTCLRDTLESSPSLGVGSDQKDMAAVSAMAEALYVYISVTKIR